MQPTTMTDHGNNANDQDRRRWLRKRHRKARLFQICSFIALGLATAFLLLFFYNIGNRAFSAFRQAQIKVDVTYNEDTREIPKRAVEEDVRDFVSREFLRSIPRRMDDNPDLRGTTQKQWVLAEADVDQYLKHFRKRYHRLLTWLEDNEAAYKQQKDTVEAKVEPVQDRLYEIEARLAKLEFQMPNDVLADSPEVAELRAKHRELEHQIQDLRKGLVAEYEDGKAERREIEAMFGGTDNIALIERMADNGLIALRFNRFFFFNGDSKLPEAAGIKAAALGSIMVLALTLAFSFPVGVLSAIYLEEFAPDNKFTQTVEVNINNLAAVPSILFGLLGLAIFINFFNVPRSSVLVGGLTLSLRTLPILIIATRAALRAVPDSIRQGALSVGATPWQTVLHHVLPLSLPGILTGTIIGLAQAMGETAPLLIVGMVAFIPEAPAGIMDSTTVLPAQIYTWSSESLRAFTERTAAAIVVLLVILLTLNATAILLRNKFERKW